MGAISNSRVCHGWGRGILGETDSAQAESRELRQARAKPRSLKAGLWVAGRPGAVLAAAGAAQGVTGWAILRGLPGAGRRGSGSGSTRSGGPAGSSDKVIKVPTSPFLIDIATGRLLD